ncbi:MAG: hypothetical protein IT342_08725 [Candidatus Melainabacteria bacterium]|nr:hypothetical protein [Candidatus Melainabacteria bacterium]
MTNRALIATNALLIFLALLVPGVLALDAATPSKSTKQKNDIKQNSQSASDLNSSDGENFFSNPEGFRIMLPRYKTAAKPAEKIRAFIQAGTPELDQIKLIGSLKGKQREEVIKAYEKGRAELQSLNTEFNDLRKTLSTSLIERMLSKEEPQMDMTIKSKDFELLLKARGMLQTLRSKRLSLWEEIQAKLSQTQLDELDKLRSGQIPAEYMDTPEATEKAESKVDTKIETRK